jgi:hypothetical protein
MGLLDGFEMLINEHGSAVILKERIALANDKYAALELKLSESTSRAKISKLKAENLESENQGLRVELEKAKVEIQNLKKLTEESNGQRLEEIKEKILSLLAQNVETTEQTIVQSLGIREQLAKFHLNDLKSSKLISIMALMATIGRAPPPTWSLTQEGRKYLVTHGLLA